MISVIVPVYNVFLFLEDCIDSICNQTYKDLEIILVDDGSTDNSGLVCDNYSKNDSRIRVIHQKNEGLSAARNAGIEIAKGEFLVFVDSDDRIHPMMVEILYEAMKQNDAELAICSHRIIQETESNASLSHEIRMETQKMEILSGRECVKRIYSKDSVDMTVAWNKLYKRNLFRQMRFPIGRVHEDEFLIYKILYPLKKCVYIREPLYEYRVRENSIVSEKSVFRYKDTIDAYEERCHFFEMDKDMELYLESLRRYETTIAETILYLRKEKIEKELEKELYCLFKTVFRDRIKSSGLKSVHKVKYYLFMINKPTYRILKNIGDIFR